MFFTHFADHLPIVMSKVGNHRNFLAVETKTENDHMLKLFKFTILLHNYMMKIEIPLKKDITNIDFSKVGKLNHRQNHTNKLWSPINKTEQNHDLYPIISKIEPNRAIRIYQILT